MVDVDGKAWRRVSDWKSELLVVRLADVPAALLREHAWVFPAARVEREAPKLAAAATAAGYARVGRETAKLLARAGTTVLRFGYHRGSDGWVYERLGPSSLRRDGDLFHAMAELPDDDDEFDRRRDDTIDAIVQVLSEGALDERTLLLCAVLPELAPDAHVDSVELATHEAMIDRLPPRAPAELMESVRAALARDAPKPGLNLSPAQRRNYLIACVAATTGFTAALFIVRGEGVVVVGLGAVFSAMCATALMVRR